MQKGHSLVKWTPWLCVVFLCLGGILPALSGDVTQEAKPRDILEKWMEARRLISETRQEWKVARQLMAERYELMQKEVEVLKEKKVQAEKDIGDGDKKLAELTEQNEELKSSTAGLKDTVAALESKLVTIVASAPVPIQERVRPLSQRIPAASQETKLSLSERFQNIIGIMNELNKFNKEILVTSEVRDLSDGTKAEVSVMYLGLGQAYYCNQGGIAGVGYGGSNGWIWAQSNSIAQAVADAMAVYRNEKAAAYMMLPLEVQ